MTRILHRQWQFCENNEFPLNSTPRVVSHLPTWVWRAAAQPRHDLHPLRAAPQWSPPPEKAPGSKSTLGTICISTHIKHKVLTNRENTSLFVGVGFYVLSTSKVIYIANSLISTSFSAQSNQWRTKLILLPSLTLSIIRIGQGLGIRVSG